MVGNISSFVSYRLWCPNLHLNLLYLHNLNNVWTVYHGAQRSTVFSIPGLDGNLSTLLFTYWKIFIYKSFLDLLPPHLHIIHKPATKCSLRSQDQLLLSVSRVKTELGEKGLSALCPCSLESASGRAVCSRAALFENF